MIARRQRPTAILATFVIVTVSVVVILAQPGSHKHFSRFATATALLAVPRNDADRRVLDAVPADGVVTYLVVGSDARAGMPAQLPALGRVSGEHADSIMLWSVRPGERARVLVLPRDIRVTVPEYGQRKLGTTLVYGSAALIQAVRSITSLPVHHYIEVSFEGFAALVDAVGGVELTLPAAIRDSVTGLSLPSGRVSLDGVAALRFVRARQAEELRSGRWVAQSSGDLGRIRRQQVTISAIVERMRSAPIPGIEFRVATTVRRGITIDRQIGFHDIALASAALQQADRRQTLLCVLPTQRQLSDDVAVSPFPPQHHGSTVMRVVDQSKSAEVLRWFASSADNMRPINGCGKR